MVWKKRNSKGNERTTHEPVVLSVQFAFIIFQKKQESKDKIENRNKHLLIYWTYTKTKHWIKSK